MFKKLLAHFCGYIVSVWLFFLADTAVCLVVILQHPKIIGLPSVHSLKPLSLKCLTR